MEQERSSQYKTYFAKEAAKDNYSIWYKVDEYYPVQSYEFLRVYRGSPIAGECAKAFSDGARVLIEIGEPYKKFKGKPTATITYAEIEYHPR